MYPALLIVAGVVLVLGIALAVYISRQPSEFSVTRSATIDASPSTVFALVSDFHAWRGWSPWEKMDPALKRTYEGSASGEGAVYSWVGNKQVGEGRMTIVESRPSDFIRIKLEFFKPFRATNEAQFTFQSTGDRTNITWTMNGCSTCMFKFMNLLMNMDKMLGKNFEDGLTAMKQLAEGSATPVGAT
jgi:uncharacterized protein YndB with AHSA1/START domain